MPKTSYKNKIFVVVALLLVISASMFLYFFHIIDNSNHLLVTTFADKQHSLEVLQAQEESFRQANSDLTKVLAEKYQPGDLFSQDVTFVNELKVLEDLGTSMNVKLDITGISGTIKTAQKATSLSNLVQIPYSVTVEGTLTNCLMFLESAEHLKFATIIPSMELSSGGDNDVIINLTGFFFLKPQ